MASSSARIEASEYSLQGRQLRSSLPASIEDKTRGGLHGKVFNAACPPDIQPRTRIVAVCGITDIITKDTIKEGFDLQASPTARQNLMNTIDKSVSIFSSSRRRKRHDAKEAELATTVKNGAASPSADGWFFSDFYLFHHLFHDSSAYQVWLTSESPETLARKYGQYLHGAAEDRRIVLDTESLPIVLQRDNIRVFPRAQLLQHFERTFRDECMIASKENQSVLLLVFGHGDPYTFGAEIGGTSQNRENNPRLTIKMIEGAVGDLNINVSIMMTSCYSGGWLYQPSLNAAGPESESLSLPATIGGRYHGSFWAAAVTKAFVKMEDEGMTQYHPEPSKEIGPDNSDDFSSTFAQLATVIEDTLVREIDPSEEKHQIRFPAKDDTWEEEWRKRSGIPLESFERQWKSLRQIPVDRPTSSLFPSRRGGLKSTSKSGEPLSSLTTNPYGLKKSISRFSALHAITMLCEDYLASSPGRPNAAPNTHLHGIADRLVAGEAVSDGEICFLYELIHYRMTLTQLASNYRKFLSLEYPDCHEFCVEDWERSLLKEEGAPSRLELHPKHVLYGSFLYTILHADIFPRAPTHHHFLKPLRYLACAFVDNNKTEEDVSQSIALLLEDQSGYVHKLTSSLRGSRLVRQQAQVVFNSLGKRLRSTSPQKRSPLP